MTTTTQEQLNWLRLARSENVGKSTFFRLIKIFGSAQKALERIADLSQRGGLSHKIKICSVADAEKEFSDTKKFGAEILLFSDENYPRLLREISDPAPILTVKGDVEFFQNDTIAIVGPRNASFNGIAFAKKVALELGQNSIITVSGMARGIDAAAHEASILSGTIGVIGGGINNIYPSENSKLFEQVMKRGLLVTEVPFGAPPQGGNFVQRNRLISGLSLAVIVVEAGLKSGSLITARFAAEQGREVFSVPGSPFDPRCRGTNRLIKDGANMFENIEDLLNELPNLRARFSVAGKLCEPEVEDFIAPISKMPSDSDIQKIREEILTKISFVPIAIEDLIQDLQEPARLVNIAIVQLELADKIDVSSGKISLRPR
jgi:DNA processing protein